MFQPDTLEELAQLLTLLRANGVQHYQPTEGCVIAINPLSVPAPQSETFADVSKLERFSTAELERIAQRRADEDAELFAD